MDASSSTSALVDQCHDDTPAYSQYAAENLFPTTSLNNSRYDKVAQVTTSHMVIEAGLFNYTPGPEPDYLPPNWQAFTHPEGQPYFYRNAGLRIVTEAHLYRPDIMDKISSWASSIEDALRIKDIKPSDTMELFLEPFADFESCGYYLVDHATRTSFWIDQVSTDLLGIGRVVSTSHLKAALEELYWAHFEFFPMHYDGISSEAVDELISVFAHGQADRMTSSTSTFPYTIEECERFIKLLKNSREQDMDGHITWIVARMWCNIARHRFSHHSGQEFARLGKDQSIIGMKPDLDHWLLRLSSSLCLGLPDVHYTRFNSIYVDHEVAAEDFRSFASDCLENWRSSLSWSLPILISNIMLLSSPSASQTIGTSSVIISGMSSILGITLSMKHEGFEKSTAGPAYRHLTTIRSDTYGFKPASVLFSLPRALCMWGLGLLMLQAMFLTLRLVHTGVAIGWMSLSLLALLGTAQVLAPQQADIWIRTFEDWFYFFQGYGKGLVRGKR